MNAIRRGWLVLGALLIGCGGNGGMDGMDATVMTDGSTDAEVDAGTDSGPLCQDADGDMRGADCALGADCDDDDANSWTHCGACVDSDHDRAFSGCDAYATVTGPDCDDEDPLRSPAYADIPDDGLDNDCSAGDVVTATLNEGVFVSTGSACSDSAQTRGARATPYCSLTTAVAEHTHGDFYLSGGTHQAARLAFSGGTVRIFGGFDDDTWARDLLVHPTTLTLTGAATGDLVTFADGADFVIDGLAIGATPSAGGAMGEFALSLAASRRVELRRLTVDSTSFLGAVDVHGSGAARPDVSLVQLDLRCTDTSASTAGDVECLTGSQLGHVELAYSRLAVRTNGRGANGAFFYTSDTVVFLNDTLVADSVSSSPRVVRASGLTRFALIDSSLYMRSEPNSYGGVIEIGEISSVVLVNNATVTSALQSVWLFEYSSTLASLVARSNAVYEIQNPAGLRFAFRGVPGQAGTDYDTATQLDACTDHCTDVGGNFTSDPLFVNAPAGDFRIPGNSPLIDVGVDARLYTTTPGVAFSFSSPRPQGAWDVGAYELSNN